MKVRLDMVTNSSSSSFICEITGEQASGWDMCLSEAEMVQCENGHTFLSSYIIKDPCELTKEELVEYFTNIINNSDSESEWNVKQAIKNLEYINSDYFDIEELCENMEWSGGYEIPDICCPICMFKIISSSDIIDYMQKTTGVTKSEVFAEIKSQNKRRRKLYDSEYIEFVCKKLNKSKDDVQKDIIDKFGNSDNFYKFLE